ncbi:cytochrome P450 family protein [Xylariaceae sp. FL1651]|nr:cytochrome P450 family protein [Xylariaceae sp. FL1651]
MLANTTLISLPLGSLAAVLVASVCAYIIYQCVFSPIASFPGPFAAKLSSAWHVYAIRKGRWHRDLVDLHRRYGPVVRIGPNELSVGDSEAFRQIYRVSNAFPKSAAYSVIKGSRSFDVTNERDEKTHAAQRRLVARPYSMESMKHLEPQIDPLIKIFLGKLDDFVAESEVIDLGYWLQLFAFDVIGAVSFGKPFGFVSSGSDNGLFSRLERAQESVAWLMHARWFFWFHQKLVMPVLGNWLAINDRNGFFFDFAKEQVAKRKVEKSDSKDIVGQLFAAQAAKSQVTDLAIMSTMTSNVFAGSDTTSISLRSILLNLIRHPKVLAKLRTELQECRALGEHREIVSADESEACHYLQAVIYEGLRVFPALAIVMERDVPPEGMIIRGKHVPSGVVVGTSAWVIHRVPEVWGPDAEEFRPERWLDKDNVGELRRHFFAFGGGTRTCLGRNISWLEMEKLVPSLVMRYDFQLADDASIQEKGAALVLLKGLRVKISRRKSE